MNSYQPIDIPIDIGGNELSPECAYFLGAIISADESFIYQNKRYWLAPVRHNFGLDIDKQIQEHMQLLQQIIGRANGQILTRNEMKAQRWFNSNVLANAFQTKQGFAAVFESKVTTTIDSFIDEVKSAISRSLPEVVQAFIVGAFDGRSAVDRNSKNNQIRYLALDCENLAAADCIISLLENLEIDCNYNTSRDRLEGGRPRKPQLRIHGKNMPMFMEQIGFVSTLKFDYVRSMLAQALFVHNNNRKLWGLKTLSVAPQTEEPFAHITPEMQELEDSLDDALLGAVFSYTYQGDPNFSYAGMPKVKSTPVDVKGRKAYKRDRKVSLNALVLANHKCEIDENHPSFVRKNTILPYSEPHHLVPLSFFEQFPVSLDVEENVVSLCSNCHNQLHYGKNIKPLLHKLYEERKELLHLAGIDVTLQELFKMYNA